MNSPDNLQDKELDAAKNYAVVKRGLTGAGGNQAEHREAVKTEAQTEEGKKALLEEYRAFQRQSAGSTHTLNNADRNENGPSR